MIDLFDHKYYTTESNLVLYINEYPKIIMNYLIYFRHIKIFYKTVLFTIRNQN